MTTFIIIGITVAASVTCFSNRHLFAKYSLSPYRVVHFKDSYQVLTHLFVHAGWAHLAFNMLTLFFFGTLVERVFSCSFGTSKGVVLFLILYAGGGIVSSIYSIVKHKNDSRYSAVGASGAVSSILFSFILLEPTRSLYMFMLPVPIPSVIFGILFLAASLYMARRGNDNIAHDAHFTGAIFGFAFTVLCEPLFFSRFIDKIYNWF